MCHPPGVKVAGVVEVGEKGDAEAAVGEGVEKAVAGGGDKEECPKPKKRPRFKNRTWGTRRRKSKMPR